MFTAYIYIRLRLLVVMLGCVLTLVGAHGMTDAHVAKREVPTQQSLIMQGQLHACIHAECDTLAAHEYEMVSCKNTIRSCHATDRMRIMSDK